MLFFNFLLLGLSFYGADCTVKCPKPENIPTTKHNKDKRSQLQNDLSLKTSRLQDVLNTKCPRYQNFLNTKHPPSYKMSRTTRLRGYQMPWIMRPYLSVLVMQYNSCEFFHLFLMGKIKAVMLLSIASEKL
jgi:hypothetical protein